MIRRSVAFAFLLGCGARTGMPVVERDAETPIEARPRATRPCEELSISTSTGIAPPGPRRPPTALLGAVERAGVLDVITLGAIVRLSYGSALELSSEATVAGLGFNQAFATNGRYLAAWGGTGRYTIVDEKNVVVASANAQGDEAASAAWQGDRLTASSNAGDNPHVPSFVTLDPAGTILTGPTARGFAPGPYDPRVVSTRSGVVRMMVAPSSAEARFAVPEESATTFPISGPVAFVTEWPFDTRSIVWHGFGDRGSGAPVTIERMDDRGIRTTVAVMSVSPTQRHTIKLVPSRWGLVVLDLANVDDVATDVTATLLHEDGRASPPATFRADNVFAGATGVAHDFVFGEIDYGAVVIAWNPVPPKNPKAPWMTQAVLLSCEH